MTQTARLGRYEIVERLAEGGMADVLLARTVGIEGFERHVVIKRIRADQARDLHYVTMFLDEARLAASLHHANVVQVNDIGQEEGEYFFAMEYVHGEDVRKILSRAAAAGTDIPLEHVLAIVMGAAAGLHHAHEQIGADGRSLGIVHRDVSPANILIGYDGGVKVVDFGIAKAAHQTVETQSGVMKGKVAYMSPEQCNNEPVDRRSDVFSLGIVLYELLLLRPLFQRKNDFLTMSAIVQHDLPRPTDQYPGLPPALDTIILKALAHDPADRYATADEMRRALEKLANDLRLRTSTTALADYMKSMFGVRREPWLVHRVDLPLPAGPDEDGDGEGDDDGDDVEIQIEPVPVASAPPPSRARRGRWIAAFAVIALAFALVLVGGARTPEPKPVARVAPPAPAAIVEPPAPAPRPTVEPEVPQIGPAPAADATPTPRKKRLRGKSTKPTKRWDPTALFPE